MCSFFYPASNSPPSLRSSPFTFLPPELSQLIIEHTIPPSYHSDTYKARQSTLRSLCLVSKLFHGIAKPLMLSVIQVRGEEDTTQLFHRRSDLKRYCLTAIFGDVEETSTALQFFSLQAHLPRLQQLTIVDMGDFRLDSISDLSEHLVSLHLSKLQLHSGEPRPFHKLRELVMVYNHEVDLKALLNKKLFPSLSALAYYIDNDELDNHAEDLNQFTLSNTLLQQLEVLSLDAAVVDELDQDFVQNVSDSLLVDYDFRDLFSTVFNRSLHARVCWWDPSIDEVTGRLQALRDLFLAGNFPRSLILPRSWMPTPTSLAYDKAYVAAWERMLADRGQMELRVEEQPSKCSVDPVFSEAFRRCRRAETSKLPGV
ncbi:hypothetical protein JCM3765_003718 [Sporobolomyces pararoseus]